MRVHAIIRTLLLGAIALGAMPVCAEESHAPAATSPIKAIRQQDHAAYMAQRKAARQTLSAQLRAEREQFVASLKGQGLTKEQRHTALQEFKVQQQAKRQAFREEQAAQYGQWTTQEREKLRGLRQQWRAARRTPPEPATTP